LIIPPPAVRPSALIKGICRSYQNIKTTCGLTLLELIIVIAIIGVLAAIAIPHYQSYITTTRYKVEIYNLQFIDRECQAFNIANGRYPNDLAEIGLAGIKDSWGNPYQYLNIQAAKGLGKVRKNKNMVPVNNDFDLYSMGPDGKSQSPFTAKQSQDDIVRAENGGYFGKVSDY